MRASPLSKAILILLVVAAAIAIAYAMVRSGTLILPAALVPTAVNTVPFEIGTLDISTLESAIVPARTHTIVTCTSSSSLTTPMMRAEHFPVTNLKMYEYTGEEGVDKYDFEKIGQWSGRRFGFGGDDTLDVLAVGKTYYVYSETPFTMSCAANFTGSTGVDCEGNPTTWSILMLGGNNRNVLPDPGMVWHSVVAYNNKLWAFGDADMPTQTQGVVYSSSDGVNWTQAGTLPAGLPEWGATADTEGNFPGGMSLTGALTTKPKVVVFNNEMWLFYSAQSINNTAMQPRTVIYKSTNGTTWTQVAMHNFNIAKPAANLVGLSTYMMQPNIGRFSEVPPSGIVVHEGKLYIEEEIPVSGGLLGQVYSSVDGISWTHAALGSLGAMPVSFKGDVYTVQTDINPTSAPNPKIYRKQRDLPGQIVGWTEITPIGSTGAISVLRSGFATAVYDGKIWVLGGRTSASETSAGRYTCGVTSSPDGEHWILEDKLPYHLGFASAAAFKPPAASSTGLYVIGGHALPHPADGSSPHRKVFSIIGDGFVPNTAVFDVVLSQSVSEGTRDFSMARFTQSGQVLPYVGPPRNGDKNQGLSDYDPVEQYVFWTEYSADSTSFVYTLVRMHGDGTGDQAMAQITGPAGQSVPGFIDIEVAPTLRKVFWSQCAASTPSDNGCSIHSVNIDGTGHVELAIPNAESNGQPIVRPTTRVAVDETGGKIYFTSGHKIYRANLDGSSIDDLSLSFPVSNGHFFTFDSPLPGSSIAFGNGQVFAAAHEIDGSGKIHSSHLVRFTPPSSGEVTILEYPSTSAEKRIVNNLDFKNNNVYFMIHSFDPVSNRRLGTKMVRVDTNGVLPTLLRTWISGELPPIDFAVVQ